MLTRLRSSAGSPDAAIPEVATARLSQLLSALLLLGLFGPAASELRYGPGVVLGLTIFMVLAGVHSIRHVDHRHRYALALTVPITIVAGLALFVRARWLVILDHLLVVAFLSIVVKVMLDHVMGQRTVTAELIRAGLAVYLLVGLWFADVYALFEVINPGSFESDVVLTGALHDGVHARVYSTRFIYYSLVTLTTLGFGDITPVSTLARSFSAVEAVIGPVFLAVFIGRLVGVQVAQAGSANEPDD